MQFGKLNERVQLRPGRFFHTRGFLFFTMRVHDVLSSVLVKKTKSLKKIPSLRRP